MLAGGGRHARHGGGGQARRALGAHPVGQGVGLVDDEQVVLGQHAGVAGHDDAEHGVVGDHDVGPGGRLARRGREAVVVEGAGRPQALGPGDRRLRPGPVGHAGDQVVAVAGGGAPGPLAQAHHLLPQARRAGAGHGVGGGEESVIVVGVAAGHPVAAQVVLPALEQGHDRAAPGEGLDGVGGQRRVPGQDLPLEGQGGGGHDGALAVVDGVDHGGHEVGQGLAGARARLDEQVGARGDGPRDAAGHLPLAAAGAAAQAPHGPVQGLQGPLLPRVRGRPGPGVRLHPRIRPRGALPRLGAGARGRPHPTIPHRAHGGAHSTAQAHSSAASGASTRARTRVPSGT